MLATWVRLLSGERIGPGIADPAGHFVVTTQVVYQILGALWMCSDVLHLADALVGIDCASWPAVDAANSASQAGK